MEVESENEEEAREACLEGDGEEVEVEFGHTLETDEEWDVQELSSPGVSLSIKIDMNNSAFEDSPSELDRILSAASEAAHGRGPGFESVLRDINGNTVGSVKLTESE